MEGVALIDMLLDVWASLGRRMKGTGLGPLSIHTLDDAKMMEGAIAPVAWADHRKLEVIGYCADDVEKSRRLFNHGLKGGWLKRPANPDSARQSGNHIKFPITWNIRNAAGDVVEPFANWYRRHQQEASSG